MVRRHCGMAPLGQTIRISVSGIAATASQTASVLPRPVRSPSRKPGRPARRAARIASRASTWWGRGTNRALSVTETGLVARRPAVLAIFLRLARHVVARTLHRRHQGAVGDGVLALER